MAKQLYDYWFMQFDFPNEEGKPYKSSGGEMVWNEKLKREIPKEWEVLNLGQITTSYQQGLIRSNNQLSDSSEFGYLKMGDLDGKGQYSLQKLARTNATSEEVFLFSLHKGDFLINVRNSKEIVGKTCLIDYVEENTLFNHMLVRMSFDKVTSFYMNLLFNTDFMYRAMDGLKQGTTTVIALYQEDLYRLPIVVPTKNVMDTFSIIEKSILNQKELLTNEIISLIKQRDELLPLLMNGQVSVNSDLAVSYIIYKDINIRIMKENIIQAIVAKMQRDLDCRQMARLKAVLTSELHNVEIIEKSDCATQQTQENEHLLNSFISAKKIEGCSDKTLTYYRNTIERLLVTLSLAICHITTTDIRTYLSNYQEEHQSSKVTIDNMRRIFSSFFAWLEDEDYIAKSPVRRIHKVKTDSLVKEVLSDEQLEQLRDSCTTKRDLAIIDFLSSTGIRVGELVKLSREDIDFHERQCVVFGKGNKERVVYFNARTKLHLQQYLNERTDSNPALFVSLNSPHSRLTISGVEVRIRKMGQALSMPKVHPHKFRRTLATMAIDKGMPIEQVQRLLGHVRIDTTLHYAIVNQNNVKLAHKKYLG
jgi:site-specific recombinase XerD